MAKVTTAAQDAANIGPFGAAAGQTGEVRFKELTANGANFVGLKSPDTLTGNVIWTLPPADGGSGDVLSTNGSGDLTWVVPPSAPVSSVNGQTGIVALNSDAISEGSTNQYFTTARARSAISASGPLSFNSGTGALSAAQANGSTAGYLSAADWTAFNAKQAAIANTDALTEGSSNKYYTDARARGALSASGPLSLNSGTGALAIAQANGSTAGYLTAADWTTFNAKQAALANTDALSEGSTNKYYTDARARAALSASGPLSLNSGTGALAIAQATGSTAGYLSATDWTTFNSKQDALAQATSVSNGFLTSSDWLTFSNKQALVTGSTALSLAKVTTAAQDAANIGPFGAAAGQTGEVRFKELTANGANFVGLKSPDTLAGNVIWTLPAADGGSGDILATNGSGGLTWIVPPSAPVTSVNGQTGAVALNSDVVSEGSTNQYFTTARARSVLSASGALGYNSGTGALSLAQANGSTAGYLSAADWTTFNAKQSALANTDALTEGSSNKYYTDARSRAALSASGPLGYNSGTGALSVAQATGSTAGYLTAADWTTFNAKQAALANSDALSEGSTNKYYTDARARAALSASGPLSLNSGTGALAIAQATGSTAGYLTAADWTTFNAKQGALANTDALTEGTSNKYFTNARARAALSSSGAISYNNTTGALSLNALTDADLSAAAAVARTKIASGSANQVLINDGSGVLSSEAQLAATRGGTGISSAATFPASGVVVTEAATETLTNKTISGSANTLTNLSASAITSGNLKASYFQDPRSTIVFFEDFFCLSTVANCNMNWTTSVATSTITPVSSTSAVHPGIVRFAGGTANTNYASLIQGTTTIKNSLLSASSGVITLESSMVVPSATGSTVRFGLCATLSAAGTCTNGVYFLVTAGVTNTSVKAEVMSSGTAYGPAADTTSFAAGAYHNYKIVITNDTTADFYVNGTLLDTVTTGAPYNAIFPAAAMNPALKYSWVTAAVNIDVDYFGYRQQFAAPR